MSDGAPKKKTIHPLSSLIAGATAGVFESIATYPAEYVKTQLQLAAKEGGKKMGPIQWGIQTIKTRGIFGLYRGLSANVIGTAGKAGVRFLAYEEFKKLMAKVEGTENLSKTGLMLAGLGAGLTEAVLVVTPTETLKVKIIHDVNRPEGPRFKGLPHAITTIVREEGLGGIYRGVTAVMMRQGANQTVRLTAYGILREKIASSGMVETSVDPISGKTILPWYVTMGLGTSVGVIVVYCTMPFDVIKTQMQSLDAKKLYKNSLDCFLKTVRSGGPLSLWAGATPRLVRLMISGAALFTVYEAVLPFAEKIRHSITN